MKLFDAYVIIETLLSVNIFKFLEKQTAQKRFTSKRRGPTQNSTLIPQRAYCGALYNNKASQWCCSYVIGPDFSYAAQPSLLCLFTTLPSPHLRLRHWAWRGCVDLRAAATPSSQSGNYATPMLAFNGLCVCVLLKVLSILCIVC